MDIKKLFADQVRKERQDVAPKAFLVKVDGPPASSKSNPDVFRVKGLRLDTGEPVYVVSVKAAPGQILPKDGDVLRADKALREGGVGEVPIYRAQYFHTYENGFCINAVMNPTAVRRSTGSGMLGAQVLALDPSSPGTVLRGGEVLAGLKEAILRELKPWSSDVKSKITHDVAGRSIWGGGANSGLTPFVVVRFNGQSFKLFGAGAVPIEKGNPSAGFRLPSDAELNERIVKSPGVLTLLGVFKTLTSEGARAEDLNKIDIAILPGLAIQVGRDRLTYADKAGKAYFAVPAAYEYTKDDKSHYGHRDSFIHVKMTRSNRLNMVESKPTPGSKMTAGVPFFAMELQRMKERESINGDPKASVQAGAGQSQPMSRAQALAMDDFEAPSQSDAKPMQATSTAAALQASPSAQPTDDFAGSDDFDPAEYDLSAFEDDLTAIERLNAGLDGFDPTRVDVDELLNAAEEISRNRANAPRLG